MNSARRVARAGRTLLTALLIGAIVIVAIVVAYVAGRNGNPTVTAPSVVTSNGSPSTGAVDGENDVAPTGCLGGSTRNPSMVLASQRDAAHSTFGAVEVAASFFRWAYQYPVPSTNDVKAAEEIFVPGDEQESLQSLLQSYQRNANPSKGAVADGKPFYVSTATGVWTTEPLSFAQATRVNVQASFVIDGALSPTKTITEAMDMRWADGAWRVVRLAPADAAKLAAGGTAFTAGC